MKKSIRPPENWQDFETLCKKLFGEIWGCPHTIKKNGRLGQKQLGVDIYGKPKGESNYWGIQCKGKDNYINTTLTKKEVDEEIQKALQFQPKLEVFIFTTTASKDVEIEEYIRTKDLESCSNGNFQILLYSWQDMVDLIEENRDTFNWYVNSIQFKDQFDIEVTFADGQLEKEIEPVFIKTITEYKYEPKEPILNSFENTLFGSFNYKPMKMPYPFGPGERNHAWCSFQTRVRNTGSRVLEDWQLLLSFSENISSFDDDFYYDYFNNQKNIEAEKRRTTWIKGKQILYKPVNNMPLIQKNYHTFESFVLPLFTSEKITLTWELLARDFNRTGELTLIVNPKLETKQKKIIVDTYDEERTEELISEFIEE